MKNIQVTFCFLLVSLFSIASVHAHDPSEHTAKMEKPKCEAMKNMDHSKLDTKDPIMMAMMKKCMSEESAENHHGGDTDAPEPQIVSTHIKHPTRSCTHVLYCYALLWC